ncbi:MAG: UvrD-helicase domain-containing protein [Gemmatimonadetes bacterium]|nr:UvrD-helicase domain-containing protein [Gemmatimonadota bacterium]
MTRTLVAPEPTAGLNPAQRAAVEHVDGPLLILAGAGSGKTRVLTARIARLIRDRGVHPSRILAVTFTNKAAGEMKERIGRQLGAEPTGIWAGTFHGIGARLLRAEAARVGRTQSFTIYDEDDTLGLLKRVMERVKVSPREWTPKSVLGTISSAKNALVGPAEYEALARDPLAKAAVPVYHALEAALREHNAVSFDDLLTLPVQILEEHPERRDAYAGRFQHVLVDEYQDTNRAQYRFVTLIGGEHGNVAVVGDDDQSIYGWRGADIRNILDFERDFPGAVVVRLEENYRSAPPVLELANVVIAQNTTRRGKVLRATRSGGEKVVSVRALDERDEADWTVEEMRVLRAGRAALQLRDMAVLYRTNAQSRAYEESLRRAGLPYRLIGAVRFYDRREIRDLMAYLRLVANPADDEAFRRAVGVPKRGLGEATVELLAERARHAGVSLLAAATRDDCVAGARPAARTALADFAALIARLRARAVDAPVDQLLRELIAAIAYDTLLKQEPDADDRLRNVNELVAGAAEEVVDAEGEVGLTPLDRFLQRATLVAGVDQMDRDADAVTLMTMHNAKGLEFPAVFIGGLEDGLFPLARAYDDPTMLEEERRLFYVGITRAEDRLYLTRAEQRRRNGELLASRQSGFLDTVPKGMLEDRVTPKARSMGRAGLGLAVGGGDDWSVPSWGGGNSRAAARRPGTPVATRPVNTAAWHSPEDESQDVPELVPGERVKHRKFGSGTIAELSGQGRDAKVKVDFDDEAIGRKTLVIALANLERGDD